MPRHRRANTTQAQRQNNACTDEVYNAGRGLPQGPNNHSIAANSAECNKCCTDSNSWLKDMNQMLEMLLTIFAPSHLNYVKFHLTMFKFVYKLILPHGNWVNLYPYSWVRHLKIPFFGFKNIFSHVLEVAPNITAMVNLLLKSPKKSNGLKGNHMSISKTAAPK